MRRSLRETTRFTALRAQRDLEGDGGWLAWIRSVVALLRSSPRRAATIGVAAFAHAFGGIAVFQFASKFVQEDHGWAPWQYSIMLLAGGGIGIVGNVVAGRLSDRIGRRSVGVAAYVLYPLAATAFYQGPELVLGLCFALIVFTSSAGDVILRAFSAELFPTSQRGAAAGLFTLLQTCGFVGGLLLVGRGLAEVPDLPLVVSVVSLTLLGTATCVLLLPESRGRELETLSQES